MSPFARFSAGDQVDPHDAIPGVCPREVLTRQSATRWWEPSIVVADRRRRRDAGGPRRGRAGTCLSEHAQRDRSRRTCPRGPDRAAARLADQAHARGHRAGADRRADHRARPPGQVHPRRGPPASSPGATSRSGCRVRHLTRCASSRACTCNRSAHGQELAVRPRPDRPADRDDVRRHPPQQQHLPLGPEPVLLHHRLAHAAEARGAARRRVDALARTRWAAPCWPRRSSRTLEAGGPRSWYGHSKAVMRQRHRRSGEMGRAGAQLDVLHTRGKVGLFGGVGYRDVGLLLRRRQDAVADHGAGLVVKVAAVRRRRRDAARHRLPRVHGRRAPGVQVDDRRRLTLGYHDYRQLDAPRTDRCPPVTAPQSECLMLRPTGPHPRLRRAYDARRRPRRGRDACAGPSATRTSTSAAAMTPRAAVDLPHHRSRRGLLARHRSQHQHQELRPRPRRLAARRLRPRRLLRHPAQLRLEHLPRRRHHHPDHLAVRERQPLPDLGAVDRRPSSPSTTASSCAPAGAARSWWPTRPATSTPWSAGDRSIRTGARAVAAAASPCA